ncbi:sensor histidine kinase [Pedobacter sp.]
MVICRQFLSILVDNQRIKPIIHVKFSPPKTEINVVLQRLAHSICIKIIDQGIGVPQADKQKIFEMFTSAKRPGTAGEQPFGIGLSISKQIIESHNGKIWLEDNPKGGTIFYIELPLT